MRSPSLEVEVCEFVREIIAARTGQPISIASRPELDHRNVKAVEELWDASSGGYAVEHTRVESFERQIANIAKIGRLLTPVKEMLAGRLPGYYVLTVREDQTTAARGDFTFAHREVERLVLDAAERLAVGETVTLRSARLPFEMRLHLRHKNGSGIVLRSDIEGDPETLRVDRFRRAFTKKCPKLATWATEGRASVLVLESDDSQHANFGVSFDAVTKVLAERTDQPDIVVYVETDASPWIAWVFKDGERQVGTMLCVIETANISMSEAAFADLGDPNPATSSDAGRAQ